MQRHQSLRVRACGLLATLALLVAACGGDDDSTTEDTSVVEDDGGSGVDSTEPASTENASTENASTENASDENASDDSPTGAATVVSNDGVLTVDVPEGAGVEVQIAPVAAVDVPPELQVPGFVLLGYDLSPDDAVFAEPVTVTFRIDPTELGVDLPEGAVPIAYMITRTGDGDFQNLGGTFRHDGEMIVASATQTHFSQDFLMMSDSTAVAMQPVGMALDVGQVEEAAVAVAVKVSSGDWLLTSMSSAFPTEDHDYEWSSAIPFSAAGAGDTASISCSTPTDAVVPDAYSIILRPVIDSEFYNYSDLTFLIDQLLIDEPPDFELFGAGTCAASATEGTTPPETPEALQPATPVSASVVGDGVVEVSFEGNAQEVLEQAGLPSAGVDVNLLAGPIFVGLSFQNAGGQTVTRSIRFDREDAVDTGDGGESIVTTTGDAVHEWVDDDTLRFTETDLEIPADATIEVQVLLETPDGKSYNLVLRP